MSDVPESLPPAAAPELSAPVRPVASPRATVAWIAVAVAVISLAASVLLWQRLTAMQEQLARQSADTSAQAVEARTLARKAEETAQADSAKVAILDSRVSELQAYRAQLDNVLQSVIRVRDENLAVDLESALRAAQDQARLSGSAEPLLAALRTVQQRARQSSDPRLASVAVAAARDMERVRSASVPDVAGLLARIDQLLREVDELPAINSVGKPRAAPAAAPSEQPAASAPQGSWSRLSQAFWEQARDLVRVSRVERPEDTILAPEQIFFIRENLKLRLMSARMSLLARQVEAARADLAAAAAALGRYFDPAARRTQAAAALLQEVQSYTRAAETPRVDATLEALARAAPDQGR
ncbi:MAG: uroporphyrinogen-III C-methyltransferase [Burkholderiaceae bacterium]|jgi:uroporphyrin-3 C-methyltransferase|nr:uroporphyrinogen-III C-methyltransferase [Burkholderiaceae bacterium]